jgi:hypothetical protein
MSLSRSESEELLDMRLLAISALFIDFTCMDKLEAKHPFG